MIKLGAVQSTSTTTCHGFPQVTRPFLPEVGDTVVIVSPTNIAPNTAFNVGVVSLFLNEQIAFSVPDDGLTVNAVVKVNAAGLAQVDVIVASTESDMAAAPITQSARPGLAAERF